MSFRLRTALAAGLLLVAFGAVAGEFTDSAGRIVVLPAQINRVMAAGPTAEVLVYVLAPDKLIGWAQLPRGAMPARYARIPVVGQLTGRTRPQRRRPCRSCTQTSSSMPAW
jgi:iron complex transport system substrate-binding protein